MSQPKFNYGFFALMLLGFFSAFVFPRGLTEPLKGKIDLLFVPVSRPVHSLAASITRRPSDVEFPSAKDQTPTQLQEENLVLRNEVANLDSQLRSLIQRDAALEKLGPIREFCKPFAVAGGDAGGQESLLIVGAGASSSAELKTGQAVLWDRSIVGRVELAGVGTARVVLVTNSAFKATVDFGRFVSAGTGNANGTGPRESFQKLPAEPATVSGDGRGRMHINQFSLDKVNKEFKLHEGDWVCLNDPGAWPGAVQGCPLGVIEHIEPDRSKSLFAHIIVKPQVDLPHLREVAVMVKK